MAIAQSISKQTVLAKQSGLGSAASTGGQIIRRTSSVFQAPADTFESNEIVDHQQSTGANYGVNRANGKIDGLLSPGTWKLPFAALLRKDFVAISALTGLSLTISGSGPTYTVARGSGSWLTDGIKVFDVIRLSVGTLNAANIAKNLMVVAIPSATQLTVIPVNGVAPVAEGPVTSCTATVVGKKSWAPLTGHTRDYFSVEEWYSDLSKSEIFTDMMFAQAQIGLPATGNATVSFDMVGRARALNASQQIGSPAAASTSAILTAVNGVIVVNGSQVVNLTGANITINGNTANLDPVIGSNTVPDNQRGRIAVNGSFSAYFDGTTIQTIFQNRSTTSLGLVVTDSNLAAADFWAIGLTRIKITSDPPDDGGDKAVVRTYNFTAEIDTAGGTNLATNQTICTIQDSQA